MNSFGERSEQQTYSADETVEQAFDGLRALLHESQECLSETIVQTADAIYRCFKRGGKVLVCGNGGSAADAQHFTAELVGRFQAEERPALPALALTTDTSVLTAWSNDYGYRDVFARQVQAFGQPGDLLLAISTSGRSPNVVRALKAARERKMTCVGLLGGSGGEARRWADINLIVPSGNSQRVQEIQMLVLHLLCELVEERLLQPPALVAVRANGNGSHSRSEEKE